VSLTRTGYSPNSIWLDSTRHDSTRSTCWAHAFWLCRASRTAQLYSLDTTSSTRSTFRARLARHDELDGRDLQLSLVMITVIRVLFNLSYSLIYWSIHLFNLGLFHLAEQIGFVCVRKNKNTCKTLRGGWIIWMRNLEWCGKLVPKMRRSMSEGAVSGFERCDGMMRVT